ncbi:MAG: hypothetical protein V1701_03735 [Planctomycetota bacterium]
MKNFYTLNPGEFFVAQELRKQEKDLQIFLPLKDIGTDLLAIGPKTRHICRIQVKESRYYGTGERHAHSWHTVAKKKLKRDTADIFVFVTYVLIGKGKKKGFQQEYIVIPRKKLLNICRHKKLVKRKSYAFYFSFQDKKVLDIREDRNKGINFTKYHNKWDLIKQI